MLGAVAAVLIAVAAAATAARRVARGSRELGGDLDRLRAAARAGRLDRLASGDAGDLGSAVRSALEPIVGAATVAERRAALAEARTELRAALDGLVTVPRAMARIPLLGGPAVALLEAAPLLAAGSVGPGALAPAGVALATGLGAGAFCLACARRGVALRADRARGLERVLAGVEAGWTAPADAGTLPGAANLSAGSLSNRRPA